MTPKLLVIGDLILDRYLEGGANRISPEAPCPVVAIDRTWERAGGAANVALAAAALGAEVTLCGRVGDDGPGHRLRQLTADVRQWIESAGRTTVKTRLRARAAGRVTDLARIDQGEIAPVSWTGDLGADATIADSFDAVILADYGLGVCSPELAAKIIGSGVPVFVDPHKSRPLDWFSGAYLAKVNRSESAGRRAWQVRQVTQSQVAVITCGEAGLEWDSRDNCGAIKAHAVQAVDTTGAGDVFLAALAVRHSETRDLFESMYFANAAAAVSVTRDGCVSPTREEVEELASGREASKAS